MDVRIDNSLGMGYMDESIEETILQALGHINNICI